MGEAATWVQQGLERQRAREYALSPAGVAEREAADAIVRYRTEKDSWIRGLLDVFGRYEAVKDAHTAAMRAGRRARSEGISAKLPDEELLPRLVEAVTQVSIVAAGGRPRGFGQRAQQLEREEAAGV